MRSGHRKSLLHTSADFFAPRLHPYCSPTCNRSSSNRLRQVHEIAEQTRRKLAERGERIKQLDEKAGELEGATSGFAEMAKQIRDGNRGGSSKR